MFLSSYYLEVDFQEILKSNEKSCFTRKGTVSSDPVFGCFLSSFCVTNVGVYVRRKNTLSDLPFLDWASTILSNSANFVSKLFLVVILTLFLICLLEFLGMLSGFSLPVMSTMSLFHQDAHLLWLQMLYHM